MNVGRGFLRSGKARGLVIGLIAKDREHVFQRRQTGIVGRLRDLFPPRGLLRDLPLLSPGARTMTASSHRLIPLIPKSNRLIFFEYQMLP